MQEKLVFGFMVYNQVVENYFQYALEWGIGHFELDLKQSHSQIHTFTPLRIAEIRKWVDKTGISLSLHPPFNLDLCTRSFIKRRYLLSYLQKCLHLAHGLKASHLTLHLGSFHRSALWSAPRRFALERLCKFLSKLLITCESLEITLALENVVPLPPEIGFAFLGDNLEDFQFIFEQLKSPFIKFCLDTGHANTNEGPIEYVEKLGDHIISVHFHDNHGLKDEHLDVGKGTVPWKDLIQLLKRRQFTGPFISECFKTESHDSIHSLKKYF